MKYKLLLIIALLFIYASSCGDDPIVEPFDYAAQALKDNDSLVKYMQEHFLNQDGELEEITNNEPAIYDDANLFEETVTLSRGDEDINYTLYHYVSEQGLYDQPERVDRANVIYKGFKLDGEVFDRNDYGLWVDLFGGVISGWSYGIIHFKSGEKTDLGDGTFSYSDTGKGILFIPSGLAYLNTGTADILPNESIIFYIELNEVFYMDHDEDTVYSRFEDINEDGKYSDDDTDEDGIPNYLDDDDDGDGVLTKDEDADGDGDPRNDDADGDDIPDYLDSDTP